MKFPIFTLLLFYLFPWFVFASEAANSSHAIVTNKSLHKNGLKEFTVSKKIKGKDCICSCLCASSFDAISELNNVAPNNKVLTKLFHPHVRIFQIIKEIHDNVCKCSCACREKNEMEKDKLQQQQNLIQEANDSEAQWAKAEFTTNANPNTSITAARTNKIVDRSSPIISTTANITTAKNTNNTARTLITGQNITMETNATRQTRNNTKATINPNITTETTETSTILTITTVARTNITATKPSTNTTTINPNGTTTLNATSTAPNITFVAKETKAIVNSTTDFSATGKTRNNTTETTNANGTTTVSSATSTAPNIAIASNETGTTDLRSTILTTTTTAPIETIISPTSNIAKEEASIGKSTVSNTPSNTNTVNTTRSQPLKAATYQTITTTISTTTTPNTTNKTQNTKTTPFINPTSATWHIIKQNIAFNAITNSTADSLIEFDKALSEIPPPLGEEEDKQKHQQTVTETTGADPKVDPIFKAKVANLLNRLKMQLYRLEEEQKQMVEGKEGKNMTTKAKNEDSKGNTVSETTEMINANQKQQRNNGAGKSVIERVDKITTELEGNRSSIVAKEYEPVGKSTVMVKNSSNWSIMEEHVNRTKEMNTAVTYLRNTTKDDKGNMTTQTTEATAKNTTEETGKTTKETAKTTEKTVKTTEETVKAPTEETAKNPTEETAKTTEKSVKTTKETAKTTEETTITTEATAKNTTEKTAKTPTEETAKTMEETVKTTEETAKNRTEESVKAPTEETSKNTTEETVKTKEETIKTTEETAKNTTEESSKTTEETTITTEETTITTEDSVKTTEETSKNTTQGSVKNNTVEMKSLTDTLTPTTTTTLSPEFKARVANLLNRLKEQLNQMRSQSNEIVKTNNSTGTKNVEDGELSSFVTEAATEKEFVGAEKVTKMPSTNFSQKVPFSTAKKISKKTRHYHRRKGTKQQLFPLPNDFMVDVPPIEIGRKAAEGDDRRGNIILLPAPPRGRDPFLSKSSLQNEMSTVNEKKILEPQRTDNSEIAQKDTTVNTINTGFSVFNVTEMPSNDKATTTTTEPTLVVGATKKTLSPMPLMIEILEFARKLREEQVKLEMLEAIRREQLGTDERDKSLEERRREIENKLAQLAQSERIHREMLAHREQRHETDEHASQIRSSLNSSKTMPCETMRRFVLWFRVDNPKKWIRQNCQFAKRHFPNASCDQIEALLSKCVP